MFENWNINAKEINDYQEEFYLNGSEDVYRTCKYSKNDEYLFVNCDTGIAYSLEDIFENMSGATFYYTEDDEDYLGVWIIE